MAERRYIRTAGEISRLEIPGYGAKLYIKTLRPPQAVKRVLDSVSLDCDPVEIYYDTKSKTARIVPYGERWVTW